MNNMKHRIGVIGAGARGESFARQLYEGTERAELAAVCDLDPDRLGKFIDYCGLKGARTFTDPAAFFAQKDMDAVVITTPDFTHRDVALQAMKAGKHIYLEKPVAPTSEQCREIIRAHRASGVTAYVGFNLRAVGMYEKLKEIVSSGILGQIVHIEGAEALSQAHGASFMRRFHRKTAHTGGFLNHKCSHDLDIMQWLVGHEHRVVRVAAFGGLNVFVNGKAPAKFCHECPREIWSKCPYRDQAGFVFPVLGDQPIHKTTQVDTYGGDLCVWTDDKDTIDNMTVIMEWDNGVRGNFNLQLFQHSGWRQTRVFGEEGLLDAHTSEKGIRVTRSTSGETITHTLHEGKGGHGGSDPKMLGRFLDAIEGKGDAKSGLAQGLAATLVAEKARLAMETGKIMEITAGEYL
jgi:predicted dehydrogenase